MILLIRPRMDWEWATDSRNGADRPSAAAARSEWASPRTVEPRSFRRDRSQARYNPSSLRGDQRGSRGGWKMGSVERTARSRASSRGQTACPGGSTAGVAAARPQRSVRGGGVGAEVGAGADLFEHEGPEQGLGTGTGSETSTCPSSRFGPPARLMAGRSFVCPQSACATAGALRPIARSMMNAPAMAQTRRLSRNDRMTRHLPRN